MRQYSGTGELKFDMGVSLKTDFDLTFSEKGEAKIVCKVNRLQRETRSIVSEHVKRLVKADLEGSIKEPAGKIEIRSLVLTEVILGHHDREEISDFRFITTLPITIEFEPCPIETIVDIHFGLTNFVFGGCEVSERKKDRTYTISRDKFSVNMNKNQIIFTQIDGYKECVSKLEETKGVSITSEANVKTEFKNSQGLRDIMNYVVELLSFATVNYVTCLYIDVYHEGKLVKVLLIPSKTMSFNDFGTVIDCDHIVSCDLQDFIETSYLNYKALKDDLGLGVVMDYYLMAREMRTLEIGYLILGVTFECLTSYLKEYFRKNGKTYSLDTLRNRMKALFTEFNVTYNEAELGFISVRDSIVHTGRFPSGKESFEEYSKLVNLIDRTILTILDYKGKPYLNFAKKLSKEVLN